MVKLRVDMRVYTEKFQFFNVKYHAIIEIVECESGRVAKKWSSASQLCEYAGTRPFPSQDIIKCFAFGRCRNGIFLSSVKTAGEICRIYLVGIYIRL